MSRLADVVRLLEAGDWERAHHIVQDEASNLASWAHGIVHMMEGDRENAAYWYRRARRALPDSSRIADEIAALRDRLGES